MNHMAMNNIGVYIPGMLHYSLPKRIYQRMNTMLLFKLFAAFTYFIILWSSCKWYGIGVRSIFGKNKLARFDANSIQMYLQILTIKS